MYRLRLLATKHSRVYEAIYTASEPIILKIIRLSNKLNSKTLDRLITWLEKQIKGLLFDCKMCGDCVLSHSGMTCPMNCPKGMRNGPCGGVRENGNCEVKPEMKCVWVEALLGAENMKNSNDVQTLQFAVNHSHQGTSSWIRLANTSDDKA